MLFKLNQKVKNENEIQTKYSSTFSAWKLLILSIKGIFLSIKSTAISVNNTRRLVHTHRCNNTLCQGETRSPRRREWRAGTSPRTSAVRSATGACCTPSAWSPWLCGRRSCSRRSSPCTGCSARPARQTPGRRSAGSRRQGSRWCTRRCGSRPGKTWRREKREKCECLVLEQPSSGQNVKTKRLKLQVLSQVFKF